MNPETTTWEHVRDTYLEQIKQVLASTRHAESRQVLDDVLAHLEQKKAELPEGERTWERFQAIITDMGPATDYVELLVDSENVQRTPIQRSRWLWGACAVCLVLIALVFVLMAGHPDSVAYRITFKAKSPFSPRSSRALLDAFNAKHPPGVRTHHYRTRLEQDDLIGSICVDSEPDQTRVVDMLKASDTLVFIHADALSEESFKEYTQTRSVSSRAGVSERPGGSSRLPKPSSFTETLERTGAWPSGDCRLSGQIMGSDGSRRIDHARICLSSERYGTWVVAADFRGSYQFQNIPAGSYCLGVRDTLGYHDAAYDPEKSGQAQPTFQLSPGQRLSSVNIELKPTQPYRTIKGRILGSNGEPVDYTGLSVTAWVKRDHGRVHLKQGYLRHSRSPVDSSDGSYELKGLDGRPVVIQVRDHGIPVKDNPLPPCFYPGTFIRSQARRVTFGDNAAVTDVDIRMPSSGGRILTGRVVDDKGKGISRALVSIFHADMWFDLFYTYTDPNGGYRLQGLDEGTYIAHVDAMYQGYVKTRKEATMASGQDETELDLALASGVAISGRFEDQSGKPWSVGRSSGHISTHGFGYASNFPYGNRYAPKAIREGTTLWSEEGQGDHGACYMAFPTPDTFLIPAVLPGDGRLEFRPREAKLVKILHGQQEITRRHMLLVEPGQDINDIVIIVDP